MLSAALDPDLDVREQALSYLSGNSDPALPAMALAQLKDCDPQVRLLGLRYLKGVPASIGIPAVVPLLDDDDPEIVAMAVSLLSRWSGVNFGVKLADAVPVEDSKTGLKVYRAASEIKARTGAKQAKLWWGQHAAEFRKVHLPVPSLVRSARQPVPAGDFRLPSLEGRQVRLSDFRGKVVLVNFWTTWCTACVGEMPELIALQKRHSDRFVILGVSLDSVPDEDHDQEQASPKETLRKIKRTVKMRGLNYPVLWDEMYKVGAKFNGGELPTTIIVDAQGFVRRRFIGARRLSVFEAMIAEASKPVPDGK